MAGPDQPNAASQATKIRRLHSWWLRRSVKLKSLMIGVTGLLVILLPTLLVSSKRASQSFEVSTPALPAAVSDTDVSASVAIDRALARLAIGKVAFNVVEHARVGRPLVVEAKLSANLTPDELALQVVEAGKVEVVTLRISDRMVATLSGGSAFDVSPNTPAEQWVSKNETTSWNWLVTPKTVGEQLLILSFDAVISIDGKDDKRSIMTLKRAIDVDVGWPETLGEWLELARKTVENISALWAAILLPIGAGVWHLWRKRGVSPKANTTSSPTREGHQKSDPSKDTDDLDSRG
jgi:hypothetical protein